MSLQTFLTKVRNNEAVDFAETIAIIGENYHYQPTEFSNGQLINAAGTNEGSCKIFAFAAIHQLTEPQTLSLFGEHYCDVLNDANGTGHQNIRNFMQTGWQGIRFNGLALTEK
jgi:hypothetical protein